MCFVRVSLFVPQERSAEHVARIQKDLLAFYSGREGFVDGYYVEAADESGVVGRVTIWESDETADRAASDDHVMALRSSLLEGEQDELVGQGFRATRVAKT